MDWIDLAQNRNKGHIVLKAVTNFRVLCNMENILNRRGRIRFSKKDFAAWIYLVGLISFKKINTRVNKLVIYGIVFSKACARSTFRQFCNI